MTPAPRTCEPLPVAAEPGRGVAEGHELIDADPLALWTRDPIEKAHSIRLSNNAYRASGFAPTRPCQRIHARLEHAAPAKRGEVDAVRALAARRRRVAVPASGAVVPPLVRSTSARNNVRT